MSAQDSLGVLRCPGCGTSLEAVERVREERVPATVPDYFTRHQEAVYRRVDSYEVVVCKKGHRLKRNGSALRGMST